MKQRIRRAEKSAHMQVQSAVIWSIVWNETGMAWRCLENMLCCGRKGIAVWHILTSDFCFYRFGPHVLFAYLLLKSITYFHEPEIKRQPSWYLWKLIQKKRDINKIIVWHRTTKKIMIFSSFFSLSYTRHFSTLLAVIRL